MGFIRRLIQFLATRDTALVRESPKELKDFNLEPGPWFESYLLDWMLAHKIRDPDIVTSGIAVGEQTDQYIWATATPEWDRDWFHSHGWHFPQRWVPFYYLATSVGEPGGPCYLRGL